jgi:hypothetical protein
MLNTARTGHFLSTKFEIPDLESNALLNKELIGKFNQLNQEGKLKNQLNLRLLSYFMQLHRKQRDLECRRLINCQQIAELRLREQVTHEECNEKISDLTEKLREKEVFISAYEKHIKSHKLLLLKHIGNPDVDNFLKSDVQLSSKSDELISTVIHENDKLSDTIVKATEKSSCLISKLYALKEEQSDLLAISRNKLLKCDVEIKSSKHYLESSVQSVFQFIN